MHIARKVLLASTLCLISAGTVSSMDMYQKKFYEESNRKAWEKISLSNQQKRDLAITDKLLKQNSEQEKTIEILRQKNDTLQNELNDAINEKTIMQEKINHYVDIIEQLNKEKNNDLDNFAVEYLTRKLPVLNIAPES